MGSHLRITPNRSIIRSASRKLGTLTPMVDMKATNEKLVHRAISIVRNVTGVSEDEARQTLDQCEWSSKTAIVMILLQMSAEEAVKALEKADGRIADAIRTREA